MTLGGFRGNCRFTFFNDVLILAKGARRVGGGYFFFGGGGAVSIGVSKWMMDSLV